LFYNVLANKEKWGESYKQAIERIYNLLNRHEDLVKLWEHLKTHYSVVYFCPMTVIGVSRFRNEQVPETNSTVFYETILYFIYLGFLSNGFPKVA